MAVTVLKDISQDEMNWYHETRYWMHVSDERTMLDAAEERGLEKGLKQGIQQGIQQGIEQITQKAVKSFYTNKVAPEIIAESLGLSIERVNEIIESK